mgnify:CR=1 FL=1
MPLNAKLGLALGSGGARGFSHIGVIEELLSLGIRPQVVAGASIGAFLGAALAAGKLSPMRAWALSLKPRRLMSLLAPGTGGLLSTRKIMSSFLEIVGEGDIESLLMPFGAVATLVPSGKEVWFTRGSLAHAVESSMAIPGMFSPVPAGKGKWFIDGGIVDPLPVALCRALGAEVVVAVRVDASDSRALGPAGPRGWAARLLSPFSPLGMASAALAVMQTRLTQYRLVQEPPDVLLCPSVGHLRAFAFHRAEEAIEAGRATVRDTLPLWHDLLLSSGPGV